MGAHAEQAPPISVSPDRAEIEARLREGRFFWLDLEKPDDAELELLRDVFGFHELAIEDSADFGQRPKLEDYDDFVFIVVYGATPDEDLLVEVHCFYSERFLVTVHHDHCPSFTELRRRLGRAGAPREPVMLLHAVIDSLIDGFFPILSSLDDRFDELETAIFAEPSDEQLKEIFDLKRRLVALRKAVAPQRDLFAAFSNEIETLPGMTAEATRAFRDVYDHLIRIGDLIDSYRDLLTGSMDVYLSRVSNRLNAVMKQLTVIATIFLPLTFLVGFFGQNFRWMINHVDGPGAFLALGIGLEIVLAALLAVMFRMRGWFG
jgi:magnesium transporter